MSAVIWFGIVAVWAFVLIPTWVRRSDIHWRRSGDASSTRDRLGHAARVVSRSGRRTTGVRSNGGRTTTVPSMRRPSSTPVRHAARGTAVRTSRTVAASSSAGRSTSVLEVEELSIREAETETLPAIHLDEPPTQQMSAVPHAPVLDDEDFTVADAATPTENVPSAQVADAAETEAPMTAPRSPRPAPRRAAPAAGAPVPPHVQRARRLVWIGATALATLLLALLFGGWWIVLNLLADAGLVAYLRYLRGIAKQKLAHKARAQTERAEGRGTRSTPVRAQRRPTAAPRHRADTTPAHRAMTAEPVAPSAMSDEAPEYIDLTDGAVSDDCPTTELTVARAV